MDARIARTPFAKVYPLYVRKAEAKGRTKADVDTVIYWLTGHDRRTLERELARNTDFETFYREAPRFNPDAVKITGVVCGLRVEEIADPMTQRMRYLDKLVDELAKGRPMAKVLRQDVVAAPAAKKPTVKKPVAKKATARKATARKATVKKATARKATAKKATARKATARKATAKKATAKKPTVKKPTVK